MKIGFDATNAFTDFGQQGIYSRSVIRTLSRNFPENEYTLYTTSLKQDHVDKDLLEHRQIRLRTPSFIVSKLKMGNIWRSTMLGNIAVKDDIDVFHSLNNQLPLIIDKRLRTVVSIQNLHFLRYPDMFKGLDLEILKRRYKHACTVANMIITPTSQTAEDLVTFFNINPEKVLVIPQACDVTFQKEYAPYEALVLSDKYKLPGDFILARSSKEVLNDNALNAVKVYVKSKIDIPLVIAGQISKKQEVSIWKIITEEKINRSVIFLKDVPLDELAILYQLCQLYLHIPSFPSNCMPIQEAICARVPTICTRIPEFIEAGGLGPVYVRPGNIDEAADTIQNLLHNPSLLSNMIEQGSIHAQNFDNFRVAQQLNELYYSLLDKKQNLAKA